MTYQPDGDRPLERRVGEQCDICGCRYRLHYILPDDIWLLVSPTGKTTGYLCPECADFRARKVDLELVFWAQLKEER